jgi:hypothetical protein
MKFKWFSGVYLWELVANTTIEWDFIHTTSSPRYPQSNGEAERQTVKDMFKKAEHGNSDVYVSPIGGVRLSPAQLYDQFLLQLVPNYLNQCLF